MLHCLYVRCVARLNVLCTYFVDRMYANLNFEGFRKIVKKVSLKSVWCRASCALSNWRPAVSFLPMRPVRRCLVCRRSTRRMCLTARTTAGNAKSSLCVSSYRTSEKEKVQLTCFSPRVVSASNGPLRQHGLERWRNVVNCLGQSWSPCSNTATSWCLLRN